MNAFLIPLINSLVLTVCFLACIIAFQADIASFFGIASVDPPNFSLFKDLMLPIFAAFGGAISGAYIAFKLQTEKEKKLAFEKNLSSVNRALFNLHMQLTDLLNIKSQFLIRYQDQGLRFVQILPMANDNILAEKINMDFAQILIEANNPQLVQDILIAEKKYFNLMALFKARNEIKNNIDKIMEQNGFGHGTEYCLGELYYFIGPQHLAKIYDTTEKFITMIDESVIYTFAQMYTFSKEIQNIFKNFAGQKVELIPDKKMKEYLVPMSTPHFKTKEALFKKAEEELKILGRQNKIFNTPQP